MAKSDGDWAAGGLAGRQRGIKECVGGIRKGGMRYMLLREELRKKVVKRHDFTA